MLECAICTKHPHEPDEDCTGECVVTDADLGIICTKCAQRIRRDLDALVDTYSLTADPAFPGGSSGEGRARSAPLPGGTDWMDWRQGSDMFGTLTSWIRDWCDVYALAGPKRADLTSITGWLRAHLPHAANSHPAITDFASEIRTLAQRGRRLAGEVSDRGQRYPCPTDECGRTLYVRMDDLEAYVHCPRCDVSRKAAHLLALAVRADAWVPEQSAADAVMVSVSTLKRWAKADHVQREAGKYWLPSVREYAATRRASA